MHRRGRNVLDVLKIIVAIVVFNLIITAVAISLAGWMEVWI